MAAFLGMASAVGDLEQVLSRQAVSRRFVLERLGR